MSNKYVAYIGALMLLSGCASKTILDGYYEPVNVRFTYYPVHNDFDESHLQPSMERVVQGKHLSVGRTNNTVLGHDSAVVCKKLQPCAYSVGLSQLSYSFEYVKGIPTLLGVFKTQAGSSVARQHGDLGWSKKRIEDGAPLYLEGVLNQQFSFEMASPQSKELVGILGDRLVISIEDIDRG
ncbi:hypothetical protein [Vibrio agarivorans]|uniref:hypothetical protein n=1 Tax=Vibrio agarivorans TaxID=153622 RepID=UPI0025B58ED3|nr:hypothetical protein [Vibrio agarivorans]MDN3661048.1 hypothetical protein [Vibrio agarivorans]